MFRVTKLIGLVALSVARVPAFAAEAHGLSAAAEPLFQVGPLPVTNSMVTSWIIAIALVIIVRIAIKRPQLVPTRGQAIVENLVQGVLDLTAPIVGNHVAKHTFPLLVALFTYILIQNWSGLLPGVGTVFYKGHELVRPGNADLNGTIALAVVAIAGWFYFIMRYAGPSLVFKDIFGNKADKNDMYE